MTKMNSYYFKEIEKIPLLSQEEEKTLAAKAFRGDKKAQKKLVEANLRFVVKIANQYKGFMDVEDLIMAGNFGLMKAAEKFDSETGNRFSTYAVWWIRNFIQREIRETSTGIRFPANKFEEMKKSKWKIASLDKAIGNDENEEITLASFLKDERVKDPEEEYIEKEISSQLQDVMKTLNPKEQTVIIKRFGLDGKDPMSLSEVGVELGYTKERIRQIEKKAISALRKKIICSSEYSLLAA